MAKKALSPKSVLADDSVRHDFPGGISIDEFENQSMISF